ncbi:MAG: pyridoxal 5'-phosphate synthase glutaminase subunit PdxT [Acidimicrobiales bacterium]
MSGPKIGILALQGAFAEHAAAFESLGAHAVEVRRPEALAGVDALVLPGGESTTMSMLLTSSGLFEAIAAQITQGTPVLGTCAGLILLSTDVGDGRPDQRGFAALDVAVLRNGYGRQRDSFETHLAITGIAGDPFTAVFIRAPRISRVGAGVDVLASVGSDPVLVRQGRILAAAFHPELSGDLRLHQMFLGGI